MNPENTAFVSLKSSFSPLSEYRVPKQYIDCRILLNKKLYGQTGQKKLLLTTKQKLKFKKSFYLDEIVSPFKELPSPNKYLQNYSTVKRWKSQTTFITKLKQNEKKLGKRSTWIQDIQRYEEKNQSPSVGKYNLSQRSDFSIRKKSQIIQKKLQSEIKYNNFDDSIYVASQIPGPGSHNPRVTIKKLKINMTNCKFWKNKHLELQKKFQQKMQKNKTSSCFYKPVFDKTFDQIQKSPKKEATLMKLIKVDKRKGINSQMLSPGPGSHTIINKWANQTFQKEKLIGKLQIFSKTSRSLPVLKVYN